MLSKANLGKPCAEGRASNSIRCRKKLAPIDTVPRQVPSTVPPKACMPRYKKAIAVHGHNDAQHCMTSSPCSQCTLRAGLRAQQKELGLCCNFSAAVGQEVREGPKTRKSRHACTVALATPTCVFAGCARHCPRSGLNILRPLRGAFLLHAACLSCSPVRAQALLAGKSAQSSLVGNFLALPKSISGLLLPAAATEQFCGHHSHGSESLSKAELYGELLCNSSSLQLRP